MNTFVIFFFFIIPARLLLCSAESTLSTYDVTPQRCIFDYSAYPFTNACVWFTVSKSTKGIPMTSPLIDSKSNKLTLLVNQAHNLCTECCLFGNWLIGFFFYGSGKKLAPAFPPNAKQVIQLGKQSVKSW